MRFLKRIGKLIGYALTYLVITLGTAVGVIFLAPSNNPSDKVTIAPQIAEAYSKLASAKALDVDLDAVVKSSGNTFDIKIDASLDTKNGFSDLKTEGVIYITINGEEFSIDFNYVDKQLFLSLFNANFTINTENAFSSISELLSLLDFKLPDLNLDLNNLDVDMILGMLSDLEETNTGDGITLDIEVPVVGKLTLKCDKNYRIQELILPELSIKDTSISLNSSIVYPKENNIERPTEEAIDATGIFAAVKSVIGFTKQETIGIKANLNYEGQDIEGLFTTDLKENARFSTTLYDKPISIYLKDDQLFFEYKNIFLKFSLDNSDVLQKFLNARFNVDLPLNEVADLLVSFKNQDAIQKLPMFDFQSGELSKLDLSVLEKFTAEKNNYFLSLKGLGSLEIKTVDDNLSSLQLNLEDLQANIEVDKPQSMELSLVQDDYIDLSQALPVANAVLETLEYQNFLGDAQISIGKTTFYVNYELSTQNGNFEGRFTITFLGQTCNVYVLNDKIFIEAFDLKIKTTTHDIEYIKSFFKDYLNLDIGKFLEEIKVFFTDLFDEDKNPVLVESMQNDDYSTTVNLCQGAVGNLRFQNTLSKVGLRFNDINLNLSVMACGNNVLPTINEDEYVLVSEIIEKTKRAIEYFNEENHYASFELSANDLIASGTLVHDKSGISILLNANFIGVDARVIIVNSDVYIDFKDVHIKADLNNLEGLFAFLKERLNVDLMPIYKQLKSSSIDLGMFDIESLVSMLNIYYKNNVLSLSINDLAADIVFNGDMIESAVIASPDFSAKASITQKQATIERPSETKYTDIYEVLDKVEGVLDYVDQGEYYADIEVNAFGLDITGHINFNEDLSAFVKTNYEGLEIEIKYCKDTIYIEANGIKLKFKTTQLDTMKGLLAELGLDTKLFDVQAQQTLQKLQNIDISALLEQLELSFNSDLLVSLPNISARVQFADDLPAKAFITATFKDEQIEIVAARTTFKEVKPVGEYMNGVELMQKVAMAAKTLLTKQFDISSDISISDREENVYSISARLQADLEREMFSARASVSGVQTMNLEAYLKDQKVFFEYNKLRLKLGQKNFEDLLLMLANLLDVDSGILAQVGDVLNGDFSGIDKTTLISLVKYIKGLEQTYYGITITVDGGIIKQDSDIKILVLTNGSMLSKIKIDGLTIENLNICADINFHRFAGLYSPYSEASYIDVSNATPLVDALIETIKLKNFEFAGQIKLDMKVLGFIPINAEVPFYVKAKLDEHFMPEIYAKIGPVPTLVGVNNDVPYKFGDTNSGSDRTINIYYKDGDIYIHRQEMMDIVFGIGKRGYEKKVKITLAEFINNPFKYIQYCFGFSDGIMNKVKEAISEGDDHIPNLANVLKSFSAENGTYNANINLQELTNSNKLGVLNLSISASDLFQGLDFNVDIDASSILSIKASGSISLTGTNVDMSNLYDYISNYNYDYNYFWSTE